jgi:uncharacterized protein (DUF427 family)
MKAIWKDKCHRRERRHRRGRRQPLLPRQRAQARIRHLQQPPHQLPLEGQASYYSLMVDGELNPEAVWYYPDPKPEAEMVKDRVAFWKGVKVGAQ